MILVVHHIDLDGIMSGAIARRLFDLMKIEVEYVTYNYGTDETKDLFLNKFYADKYEMIIFIDVTPPIWWYDEIEHTPIVVFDHHKQAYDDFKENVVLNDKITYLFKENWCGAKIFYHQSPEVFKVPSSFYNDKINNLIELVDQYDTWKWYDNKNFNALYLSESVNNYFKDYPEEVYQILKEGKSDEIQNLIKEGKEISKSFEMIVKSNKVMVKDDYAIVNATASYYSIEHVKTLIKEEKINPIKCIIFYKDINWSNETINLSCRSIDTEFDCAKFMKTIANGGGHKAAAGGQMKITDFVNFLN